MGIVYEMNNKEENNAITMKYKIDIGKKRSKNIWT